MPLLEPEDKQPDEQINLKLRPEVALALRQYQEFTASSHNHVITGALKRLFEADKEFKVWREQAPKAVATTAVKARKPKAMAVEGSR